MPLEQRFEAYSLEHFAPLVLAVVIGWLWIGFAKTLPRAQRSVLGFYPSLILPGLILLDVIYGIKTGSFDIALDLPLHMCRIVTFLVPIMLLYQHRNLFGVLYFWVLAGTTQAVLTPDILTSFPSYEYIRYWVLHTGLILTIAYSVAVFDFRPTWKDLWKAVIAAQIYLLVTLPINWLLSSNYGYTMEKPPVASIADYLGPWPWYIVSGELIMIVLFLILYLPFGIKWLRKYST